MSPRRRNNAIAAAVRTSDWDRLSVALALAAVRLLETLPADVAPEMLALLDGDNELTAHGEPVEPQKEARGA